MDLEPRIVYVELIPDDEEQVSLVFVSTVITNVVIVIRIVI